MRRFHEAMKQPNPHTAVARAFWPGFLEHGFLQEGDLEKGPAKFSDKNLMLLRKRHVARLMAQLAVEEREAGQTADESAAIAQVVTFAWKTMSSANRDAFYAGFFGHELTPAEAAALKLPSDKLSLERFLEEARSNPSAFWGLTPSRQQQLLGLDRDRRVFRLPTSGMARPFADQGSYSDCVESTGRGGILEMLRNPVTGEMEPHLLPDTCPFKAYFVGYADERGRLSADGRDFWAAETWKVPGVRRVKDKFGYIPSLENTILTYQRMIGDQETVVLPITAETTVAEVAARYRAFFARASSWFTQHLGRPVQLSIEESDITLLREENRTVGMIHIKNQPKADAAAEEPLKEAGYLNVMAHHGDYEHVSQTSFSDAKEEDKEDLPLVELVSPVAPSVDDVLALLPWMTSTLMKNMKGEVEQAAWAEVQANMKRYFPRFNFVDSPKIYVAALEAAMKQGTPADLSVVLKAGILSKFSNSRFIGLLFNDLMDKTKSESKAEQPASEDRQSSGAPAAAVEQLSGQSSAVDPREVVRALVRRAPSLLRQQAPYRDYVPNVPDQLTSSILDFLLEWEDMDLLREVGDYVNTVTVNFGQKNPRQASDSYWATLAQLPEAFTHIQEVAFTNSHNILSVWTAAERDQLREKLPLFAALHPKEIDSWMLTPEILEFLAPAISSQTTTLLYTDPAEYWNTAEKRPTNKEEKVAADRALRAKFAEMQAAGQLPATLKLKAQGELAALSRTK